MEDLGAGTGEHQGDGVVAAGLSGIGSHVGELQRELGQEGAQEVHRQIPDQINGRVLLASLGLPVGRMGLKGLVVIPDPIGQRCCVGEWMAANSHASTLTPMPSPGGFLSRTGVVRIVPAVAVEAVARRWCAWNRSTEIGSHRVIVFIPAPEPGEILFGAQRLLAAIFGPFDGAGPGAQDAGAGFPALAQLSIEKGADVEANAVVGVGIPTNRLLVQGLPTHENVVGRLAIEDLLELALKIEGGGEPVIGAIDAFCLIILLAIDPVAQVGEGELIQGFAALAIGGRQLVIVHQGAEAIDMAIPDLPDEGPTLGQLAVFAEKLSGDD